MKRVLFVDDEPMVLNDIEKASIEVCLDVTERLLGPAAAVGNRRDLEEEDFRVLAESIVQNIDEVIFWRDLDNVTPYFVSHAYESIWGMPCESVYANPSSWIES